MREERLAELLGGVIRPLQISPQIAEDLGNAIRATDVAAERHRTEAVRQCEQRRRAVVARLDRGYDDFLAGRISEEFWTRKSREWERELQLIDGESARVRQPRPAMLVTASKILELAQQAELLYKSQNPTEQRRLLETVLSNCTLDRGSLSVTYSKPFDLLVRGNETGDWRGVWDDFRNYLISAA